MFNSGGFGGGFAEGGFDAANTSQTASPSVQKKERRTQNVVPITIKTILNSPEDNVKIHSSDVHMAVIVGLIRSVDVSSTKVCYKIDDSTGTIDVIHWNEGDSDFNETQQGPLMEMTYCKVVGSTRTQQSKKYLMVFKILPITDINLITNHMLEVIHCDMKLRKQEIMGVSDESGASFGKAGNNSFAVVPPGHSQQPMHMQSNKNAGADGLSGPQRLVFQMIQLCKDDAGIGRHEIYQSLLGKVSSVDIDKVLDFLSGEGHIYTTIDDDTFRTTDS